MLEREKEISFDVLVEAIEQALLTAYHKTPGAVEQARVELDRKSGHVTVFAAELDDEGNQIGGVRRHPRGLRPDRRDDREADHAAAAARRRGRHPVRRVLRQGGRPDLRRHPAGPQPRRRDGRPRQARGAAAARRAGAGGALPARRADQVPGGLGAQGACAAPRSRSRAPTPTWSRSCSRSRCPRSPTAPSRSPRSPARPATAPRSRSGRRRPGVNAKGSCIGPMGQRVRNVMSELHGEKIDIVDWSEDPARVRRPRPLAGAGQPRRGGRRRGQVRAGGRARLPAVAGDRQGGPERPPRRPADRLAHRHPLRRRVMRRAATREGRAGSVARPGRASLMAELAKP